MGLRSLAIICTIAPRLLAVDADSISQAQRELFAARFDRAAQLYSGLVKSDPSWAPGYYGWVRALLGAYRAPEAYAAADVAQKAVPGTAFAEAALGLAAYRRGELFESDRHFRRAIQLDPNQPAALLGLARISSGISKFKSARELNQAAYRSEPDDPNCILAGLANQQEGEEHIATLERVLSIYDPTTREARELRAHIASDRVAGSRKLRRLVSPYQHYEIKLVDLMNGPGSKRGMGVSVEINQRKFKLLLDTGASGIAISQKSAKKAGLEGLGEETVEARGVGDNRAADAYSFLAQEVRIGDLTLASVPVAAYTSASVDVDGLIGADVFKLFLISIDFVHRRVSLDPFEHPPPDLAMDAADTPAKGYFRAFRLGNYLALSTSVNGSDGRLFLIDSGSSSNLIDTSVARESTKTYGDDLTRISGIQGSVNKVSRAQTVTLVFAGFRQENPDLLAIDMNKLSDGMGIRLSGVLGMPTLGLMKLTIDYREGVVRLELIKP